MCLKIELGGIQASCGALWKTWFRLGTLSSLLHLLHSPEIGPTPWVKAGHHTMIQNLELKIVREKQYFISIFFIWKSKIIRLKFYFKMCCLVVLIILRNSHRGKIVSEKKQDNGNIQDWKTTKLQILTSRGLSPIFGPLSSKVRLCNVHLCCINQTKQLLGVYISHLGPRSPHSQKKCWNMFEKKLYTCCKATKLIIHQNWSALVPH